MPNDEFITNVRDYVRNNIAVEFKFGLSKGGRGALIDQSGTSFDQAELMVKVLRAGGLAAGYRSGTITLNAQQFGHWSGLVTGLTGPIPDDPYATPQSFTVDKRAACQFLADGGIPASFEGGGNCETMSGSLGNVSIAHVWVTVGGQNYDPSLKYHVLRARKDIPQMMGCGTWGASTCTQAMTSAISSAQTSALGGVTSYDLSGAVVAANTAVGTLAANLQHAIEAQGSGQAVEELVGGRQLVAPGTPPSLSASYNQVYEWAGDIPDIYRTRLIVKAPLRGTFNLFADELAGRRMVFLGIDGAANKFLVDGVEVNEGCFEVSCQAPSGRFELSVNHPYPALGGGYADETLSFEMVEPPTVETGLLQGTPEYQVEGSMTGSFPVTIVHGFGGASSATPMVVNELLNAKPEITPAGANCKPSTTLTQVSIIPADCAFTGAATQVETIRVNTTLMEKIVDGVTTTRTSRHHDLGVLYSSRKQGGVYLSVQSAISISPILGADLTARAKAFEVGARALPYLEAASTMTFRSSYVMGGPAMTGVVLDVPPAQMAAVIAALPSLPANASLAAYEQRRRLKLQAAADLGYNTVMTPDITVLQGELFYKPGERGYAVWQSIKGAGVVDPAQTALKTTELEKQNQLKKQLAVISPATGDVSFSEPPDIVTGSGDFPRSLPFIRTYSAGATERLDRTRFATISSGVQSVQESLTWVYTGPDAEVAARLGAGWTHNYNVSGSYSIDASRALGSASALEASQIVARTVAATEAAGISSTADRLRFLLVQLGPPILGFTVKKGVESESFVMLPDGRMNPPPRSQASLTVSGAWPTSTATYTGAGGDKIFFDAVSRYYSKWCEPGYKYANEPYLRAKSWSFPDGVRIDFDYELGDFWTSIPELLDGCRTSSAWVLSKVSNNLGRSLTITSKAYNAGVATTYNPGAMENNQGQYGMTTLSVGYRITKVVDENGRSASYELSCSSLLCSKFTVTNSGGMKTRYEYAADAQSPDPVNLVRSPYRLRKIFSNGDPSIPLQTIIYDELFRVKETIDKANRKVQFFPGSVVNAELWKRSQTISARTDKAEVTTTILDAKNSAIVTVDPLGRVSRSQYDAAGRLIRSVSPSGVTTMKEYDARSNLLSECVVPKERLGSACSVASGDLKTQYTYKEARTVIACDYPASCNRVATETSPIASALTNPAGAITEYSWDDQTGLLTRIVKPADLDGRRPQIDATYEKLTGSDALFLKEKTEKINAADTLITKYEYDTAKKFALKAVVLDAGGKNIRTCYGFDAKGDVASVTDARAASCP